MRKNKTDDVSPEGRSERSARGLGLEYERLVRRRVLLIVIHAVLGLIVAIAWVSRQDFYALRYLRRLFRDLPTAYALAAVWPYLLSAIMCYRAGSPTRKGMAIFTVVLLAGTIVATAVYLRAPTDYLWSSVLAVSLGEGALFAYAATHLTRSD